MYYIYTDRPRARAPRARGAYAAAAGGWDNTNAGRGTNFQ